MKKRYLLASGISAVAVMLASGCASSKDTAMAGAWLGRQLGTPLGFTTTVLDETFLYAGDIAAANPRYEQARTMDAPAQQQPAPQGHAASHYIEARVRVETDAPVTIRSLTVEDSKDVTAFWSAREL